MLAITKKQTTGRKGSVTFTLRARATRVRRGMGALWCAAVLAGLAFSAQIATACAFDMTKPERTAIDWIVDADTLVLARPGADNRFRFDVIDVLVGSDAGHPIPQLVDSATRRKLAAKSGDAVLFALTKTGSWRRVAYVDDAFRGVLHTTLSHRDAWRAGMPQSRIDFIDTLQGWSDPRARAIVIGELDKVPYAQLRQFELQITAQALIADLWTAKGYPYQAIHALLIGLSGSPKAREVVSGVIQGATDRGQPANLGAFAAAYIELDGAEAASRLARDIFLDPSQTPQTVEQVVIAMAVHHDLADTDLQTTIDTALANLLQARPSAGVIVARQFMERRNWSQTAALQALVAERKFASTAELLPVAAYLARARSHQAARLSDQNGG